MRLRRLSILAAAIVASTVFASSPAIGAGQYVHTTTDPAYYTADGEVLADPYQVGEGSRASSASILYWGPLTNGDTHHILEKAGWPYARTRAVLAVAFPCIANRYCFDHDAAAQLLANGLTWNALDALYERR